MGALLKRAGRLCDRNQAVRGSWSAMIHTARCVAAASVSGSNAVVRGETSLAVTTTQ
jgi:hypothetical protein